MVRTERTSSFSQGEFKKLHESYKQFIELLKGRWLRYHNSPPRGWTLYELDATERQRVDTVIRNWEHYVTPIAEKWWNKRGFCIHWPLRASEPCNYSQLQTYQQKNTSAS